MSIQPPSDKLNVTFTDTLSLETYCSREDSVLSDETSANLLGTINDPTFGMSNAGFVTQFSLPTANLSFAGATLDSVVLSLAYSGYYGDILTAQNIQVFEISQSEQINKDSVYYSNRNFQTEPAELANITITPTPNDSVLVGGTKYAPHLRIKLDNSLGQKFIDASGTSNLASTTAFREFFKGLKIVASSSTSDAGAILYFDLLSKTDLSKLTLYYKNDTVPASYNFKIDATCARVNQFKHDYSSKSNITNQLGNHSEGQTLTYLQPMAGLKIHLGIPTLKKLNDLGQISINKAELVINAEEANANNTTFPVPPKLTLIGIDDAGNSTYIIDQFEAESYYGGTYDTSKKQYTFNIARHLQEIVSGRINNNGLTLLVSGSSIKANRLVIHGGGKSNPSAMRLKLTYTKIK